MTWNATRLISRIARTAAMTIPTMCACATRPHPNETKSVEEPSEAPLFDIPADEHPVGTKYAEDLHVLISMQAASVLSEHFAYNLGFRWTNSPVLLRHLKFGLYYADNVWFSNPDEWSSVQAQAPEVYTHCAASYKKHIWCGALPLDLTVSGELSFGLISASIDPEIPSLHPVNPYFGLHYRVTVGLDSDVRFDSDRDSPLFFSADNFGHYLNKQDLVLTTNRRFHVEYPFLLGLDACDLYSKDLGLDTVRLAHFTISGADYGPVLYQIARKALARHRSSYLRRRAAEQSISAAPGAAPIELVIHRSVHPPERRSVERRSKLDFGGHSCACTQAICRRRSQPRSAGTRKWPDECWKHSQPAGCHVRHSHAATA